jgi:hypothetical protein
MPYKAIQCESTEIDLNDAVFVNTILPNEELVTVQFGPESFEIEQCTIGRGLSSAFARDVLLYRACRLYSWVYKLK